MSAGSAGAILLLQGLIGVALGPLIGHLLDTTENKRMWLAASLASTALTFLLLLAWGAPGWVGAVLAAQGAVAAVYPPAINSISLGVTGQANFPTRAARNEVFKHVGAICAALLPIVAVAERPGGYQVFFGVVAGVAMLAVLSVLLIKADDIDHHKARGARAGGSGSGTPVQHATAKELLTRPAVMLFLAAVFCFHFANAAMLPEVGLKIDTINIATGHNTTIQIGKHSIPLNGKNGVSIATLVAQLIMIPVAKLCGHLATKGWAGGSVKLLLLASLTLPIRAFAFAASNNIWTLLGLQFLDGISAGAFGVLAVLIMCDLTEGTGRFSMMQGALATAIGGGAAASNGIAGAITDRYGFEVTFHTLGFFSLLTCLLLLALAMFLVTPDRSLSKPSPSQRLGGEEHIPLLYVRPDLSPVKRTNYAKSFSEETKPSI